MKEQRPFLNQIGFGESPEGDEIMTMTPEERANQFIREETQFHLGFLVTEQSHPKTRGLSDALAADTARGLAMLYSVDDDIPPILEKTLASPEFLKLTDDIKVTLLNKGRIFFSGCGATGRLAILLDASNRRFWEQTLRAMPHLAESCQNLSDSTSAVMTGGDYALVRSVESFEDFISFGFKQMIDAGVSSNDMVVAISEGGETSSVIGTIHAGRNVGARVHFLFNNPATLLKNQITRSRDVIVDKQVNVLDLTTGPMGVAGSTRMQATTMELLVAGIAFETALLDVLKDRLAPDDFERLGFSSRTPKQTAQDFNRLLTQLRTPENLAVAAAYTDFEADIYRNHGRITYFADDYLLDIFTDTTERSPTFKIPPFRPEGDLTAPAPWAFVKDVQNDSVSAWQAILKHTPHCLNWTPDDFRAMDAPESIVTNPPQIGDDALYRFKIGNEPDASRTDVVPNAAVALLIGDEIRHATRPADPWQTAFAKLTADYQKRVTLVIGPEDTLGETFFVKTDLPATPLDLFGHLAAKLVLNNVSSATMGKIGRLSSNWMAHVEASNKKLIDRSIRLVSELGGVDYQTAAIALFETMDEMADWPETRRRIVSPAARAAEKFQKQ